MTEQVFAALRPIFQPLVEKLTAMPSAAGPRMLPERRGLYVLSEGSVHLYVGITGNLSRRWNDHRYGRESGATFAIKLAREKTRHPPKYNSSEGLKALLKLPDFAAAFTEAKARVRQMDVRFLDAIEDDDDLAILEVYVARALGAAYNDFKPR